MTQAEQIYWRKFKSKNSIWTTPQEIAIAAINEALNVNADKVKKLEEENKRLMEGISDIVRWVDRGIEIETRKIDETKIMEYKIACRGSRRIYYDAKNYLKALKLHQ